ncbi:MAG: GNAT family N-acetyltransferase [Anaerolineae bacterium]
MIGDVTLEPHLALRRATAADEPFLWRMLYYASHMDKDAVALPDDAKTHPYLARFVEGWGRPDDLGVIAEDGDGTPIGAAWVRVLPVADGENPEMAIAVLPDRIGRGVGSAMLARLLDEARGVYGRIYLSVRDGNPALRLYERAGFVVVRKITNRVGGKSYLMRWEFPMDGSPPPDA